MLAVLPLRVRLMFRSVLFPKYGGGKTRVTLICKTCGATARRILSFEPGSRGTHETSSEPASCPKGHGPMVRKDGVNQEDWALWSPTAKANQK